MRALGIMVLDMKIGDMVRMIPPGTPSWHGGVVGIYMGPEDEKGWGDYHYFMREGKICWADADYVKNRLEVVSESRGSCNMDMG
jgi:hypothetical protein